jgi:hypothetical protein
MTPATALQPARLDPASRVPVEFIGQARVLLGRIGRAHDLWVEAAEQLTAPLSPRGDFRPQFTRQSLALLAARWRALPEWGRLRIVAKTDGARLQVLETRLIPFRCAKVDWDEFEPSVAVALSAVGMALPAGFTVETRPIAVVGLHALARRYERGSDRSDSAVLRDLSVFGRAWPEAALEPEFEIPALRGGQWFEEAIREIGRRVKSRKEPMPTTGYFERKTEPGGALAPISVGDAVRWNGRYEGKVISTNCETAIVVERHNRALGHAVKWRLRLDALTKIEDRDQ